MEQISTHQLKEALIHAAARIVENEPYLTEIDSIIGDGDHGIGMKSGFRALTDLLERTEYETAYELFRAAGLELLRVMGGASGVIFGTLFISGREAMQAMHKREVTADELIVSFRASRTAIMKRGRSAPGDKTMLDALSPAIDAMERRRAETADIARVLQAGARGAREGAEASAHLLPRTGRSKNFREKGIGYPDPGAVSTAILFEGIADYISSIKEGE